MWQARHCCHCHLYHNLLLLLLLVMMRWDDALGSCHRHYHNLLLPPSPVLQVDRHEEMLRSCLRAVDALERLPGAEACAPFAAFLKRTVRAGALAQQYAAVQAERAEAEGGAAANAAV